MVAIDRVWTMQLFVLEAVIWLIIRSHWQRQLMMHKIVSELIVHTRANSGTWRTKEQKTNKSTGGAGWKPSEG